MQKSTNLSLILGALLVFGIGFGTSSLLTQATQDSNFVQEFSIEESTEKEVKTAQEPIMREQNKKKDQFSGFDLVSDTSFQRFLNDEHPFNDPKYEPEDLAPIESDFTTNAARKFQLRKEA